MWQRFPDWVTKQAPQAPAAIRKRTSKRVRPRLDALEDRTLLAYAASIAGGVVTFTGDGAADLLSLTDNGSGLLRHNRLGDPGFASDVDLDSASGGIQSLALTSITNLVVNAGAGDDTIDLGGLRLRGDLNGGAGNDLVTATHDNDITLTNAKLTVGGTTAGQVTLGSNFVGSNINQSGFIPPDTMGAVGIDHFVELINGRYAVYSKATGAVVQSSNLDQFWQNSGLAGQGGTFDPRVIFDHSSSRWFACAVDNGGNANNLLLAVSITSDPTQGWRGLRVDTDPTNGRWCDYPTLGVDADGVYVAGNMFTVTTPGTDVSIWSFPKADLLLPTPTVANRTEFLNIGAGTRGFTQAPATDFGPSDGRAAILSNFTGSNRSRTSIIGAGAANAQLSATTVFAGPNVSQQPDAFQPDGSRNLDSGDNRFGQGVFEVGDSLWVAHGVNVNGSSGIRWYEISEVTNAILQTGTIADPNFDFFYPAICANEFGDVVIGFTRAGLVAGVGFASSYAVVGSTSGGVTTFGQPMLLRQGVANYFVDFGSGRNRWGDYSATTLDPTDHRRFWTIQEYASATNVWSTQFTEIIISPPAVVDFNLVAVEAANLTGGGGQNEFDVTGWTGTGTLNGLGGTDVVVLTRNGNFTVASDLLAVTAGPTLALQAIEEGTLTAGTAANSFTVNSWAATGTLRLAGSAGNDTYFLDSDVPLGTVTITEAVGAGNDILSFVNSTTSNVTINLGLTSLQTVNANLRVQLNSGTVMDQVLGGSGTDVLTGNALNNQLTGGPGNDTISGGSGDDTYTFDADAPLGTDQLSDTAGVDTLDLSATATLGLSVLLGTTGSQTVNANLSVNLTSATAFEHVIGSDGNDTLGGNGQSNILTGGLGSDTYLFDADLSQGSDAIVEVGADVDVVDFSATTGNSNNLTLDLAIAGGQLVNSNLTLDLVAGNLIENVIGGGAGDNFRGNALDNLIRGGLGDDTISGGPGADTLLGEDGIDRVVETRNVNFVLSDVTLQIGSEGTDTLGAMELAYLTGGDAVNSFTVSAWSGGGLLDGLAGDDLVVATNDTSFILANGSLARGGLSTIGLQSIEIATLTGGTSDNTFHVGGWTGRGTFVAGGHVQQDRLIQSGDVDVTLSDTTLVRGGLSNVTISGFEFAILEGGNNGNLFNLSGWTNFSTIDGGGGDDTIAVASDSDFILSDFAVERFSLPPIELQGVESARLTGGFSANLFFVTNWTGGGLIDGQDGLDRVVATNNVNYNLSDTKLSRGIRTLEMAAVEEAELTGGDGHNVFTVDGWSGLALIDGKGDEDTYEVLFHGTGSGKTQINDTGVFGSDVLTASGTTGSDNINVLASGVTRSGEVVNYKGLEGLTVEGGDGNDAITSKSTSLDRKLAALVLNGGLGNDTFTITPTNIRVDVDGGDPVAPTFPGDVLNVIFNGAKMKSVKFPTVGSGNFKFTNRKDLNFVSIESGRGAGGRLDLLP